MVSVGRLSTDIFGSAVSQLGFGAVVGFVVGYTAKKIIKLMLIFLGIFFVAMQYLAYQGFLTINYTKFQEAFELWAGKMFQMPAVPAFVASGIPFYGSLAAGFLIGFKKG